MRVVVALGGNALLRRGQPLTAENQRANARAACEALAPVALEHELVISHGNGPQVGLLALQGSAYTEVEPYPLDVLGAQTEGMIGYIIQQELGNELPQERPLATLLTMIEVDARRPGVRRTRRSRSARSTTQDEADAARARRRAGRSSPTATASAASSPRRCRSGSSRSSRSSALLEQGCVVDLRGRRRHPDVVHVDEPVPGRHGGSSASRRVIDKDLASALLAIDLDADVLVIVTDVDAVYAGWGTPDQRAIRRATPGELAERGVRRGLDGPEGPRRLRVRRSDRRRAAIGSINDTAALLRGEAGTTVALDAAGIEIAEPLGGERDDGSHRRTDRRRARTRTSTGSRSRARTSPATLGVDTRSGLDARRGRDAARAVRPERVRRGRRPSRAGARSCASTATRCRSSCSSPGIGSIWPLQELGTGPRAALPDAVQRRARPEPGGQGRRGRRRAAEDDDHQGEGPPRRRAASSSRRSSSCPATSSRSRPATSSRPTAGCCRRRRSRSPSRR